MVDDVCQYEFVHPTRLMDFDAHVCFLDFIKLGPSSVGVTKTSFSEALRRGYINTQTGKYACPSTGQIMSVDEAVRRGLLVDETGHRLGGEDMTIKPNQMNRQSRSFETALKHGMIDSRYVIGSFNDKLISSFKHHEC